MNNTTTWERQAGKFANHLAAICSTIWERRLLAGSSAGHLATICSAGSAPTVMHR